MALEHVCQPVRSCRLYHTGRFIVLQTPTPHEGSDMQTLASGQKQIADSGLCVLW